MEVVDNVTRNAFLIIARFANIIFNYIFGLTFQISINL